MGKLRRFGEAVVFARVEIQGALQVTFNLIALAGPWDAAREVFAAVNGVIGAWMMVVAVMVRQRDMKQLARFLAGTDVPV